MRGHYRDLHHLRDDLIEENIQIDVDRKTVLWRGVFEDASPYHVSMLIFIARFHLIAAISALIKQISGRADADVDWRTAWRERRASCS